MCPGLSQVQSRMLCQMFVSNFKRDMVVTLRLCKRKGDDAQFTCCVSIIMISRLMHGEGQFSSIYVVEWGQKYLSITFMQSYAVSEMSSLFLKTKKYILWNGRQFRTNLKCWPIVWNRYFLQLFSIYTERERETLIIAKIKNQQKNRNGANLFDGTSCASTPIVIH